MQIDNTCFNALSETTDIFSVVNLVNQNSGSSAKIRPELFYSKQLLETIRLGADQFPYYRLAESSPIPDKSRKLQLRRWAPLQAHTEPLVEGIPPHSDKGSVETYEIETFAYGRFMEFTDRVDLDMIDPVIAQYTKEYAVVAVETLDMLARDQLFLVANKAFANQKANITKLTLNDKPTMADLRLAVLQLKKDMIRPRSNGRFHVICSPEFVYDMITDPIVEKFMQYNNSTKTMYENGTLVPMFDMEFYESMSTPNDGRYVNAQSKKCIVLYRYNTTDSRYEYMSVSEDFVYTGTTKILSAVNGYVNDSRTGQPASYIPNQEVWNLAAFNAASGTSLVPQDASTGTKTTGIMTAWYATVSNGVETITKLDAVTSTATYGDKGEWKELKIHHCAIVGKDALIRTGMSGHDNAKMYVKGKGSAGVLDPIDQRQSIGFKIDSVGFGSARTEAIIDYMCVPSTLNV